MLQNELTYTELNAMRLKHGARCCDPPQKQTPVARHDHKRLSAVTIRIVKLPWTRKKGLPQ